MKNKVGRPPKFVIEDIIEALLFGGIILSGLIYVIENLKDMFKEDKK